MVAIDLRYIIVYIITMDLGKDKIVIKLGKKKLAI